MTAPIARDLAVSPQWQDADCSLPTASGFLLFGALGALAARRGRRLAGAMDGVFGSWVACAAARASGTSASPLWAMFGAYAAAKVYEG